MWTISILLNGEAVIIIIHFYMFVFLKSVLHTANRLWSLCNKSLMNTFHLVETNFFTVIYQGLQDMATCHFHDHHFSYCSLHSSHNVLSLNTSSYFLLQNLWIFCVAHPLTCFSSLWHVTLSEKCSLTVHPTNNDIPPFPHHSSPFTMLSLSFVIYYLIHVKCMQNNACHVYLSYEWLWTRQ